MAWPRKTTYIDKDGISRSRGICSIEGCSRVRQLCKLKGAGYIELSTCSRHRKDGGVFDCHSKSNVKEHIWRNQGIKMSYEEYVEMLELNGYCCWLCGKPQSEEDRDLGVDHDHETGDIRGILCRRCNGILGWLESVTSLDELKDYMDGKYMDIHKSLKGK